jgi:hypothetical protein
MIGQDDRTPAPEPPRRTLVLELGPPPLEPSVIVAPHMAPTMAISAYGSQPGPPMQPLPFHPGAPFQAGPPHPYGPPAPAHPGYFPPPPISGRFRAVGPVRIPITPSPARIVIGTVLAAVALWLALWFFPQYRDRLSEEVRMAIGIGAGCFGLAAFGLILSGALYRAQAEVHCRRCGRPVIAWKGAFGLHCPLGPHHARINWIMVVVTASFWATLLVVGIGLVAWLA